MAKTGWQCSQCGTANEAGSRACSNCGKWPSLFDLQGNAVDDLEPDMTQTDVFETEAFETDVFEPDAMPAGEEGEERRGRFPRWVVTAIWVIGILVWIVVNALGDRG
jgi:predicted ATP-dependent serine protease